MPGAHRLHGKPRAHRTVYAAAHRDNDPGTPQRLPDLDPERFCDPSSLGARIEL
jgi:hypothetical protein